MIISVIPGELQKMVLFIQFNECICNEQSAVRSFFFFFFSGSGVDFNVFLGELGIYLQAYI
jgi:hypothetical protein